MNTLTKSLAKRALSILLVAIMVLSLGIVGITSTSAAEVEIVETGATFNVLLLGTFTNWNTTPDSTNTMSTTDSTNYTKTLTLSAGNYSFKIYQTGGNTDGWYGKDNSSITDTGTLTFGSAGQGGDITFTASSNADYTFTYNTATNSITVTKSASGGSTTTSYFEVGSSVYLHTGGTDLWSAAAADYYAHFFNDSTGSQNDVKMTQFSGESYVYSATVPSGEWDHVIFLRVAPGTAVENIWDDDPLYNRTSNLACLEGNNMFTIDAWHDPNNSEHSHGTWSTYTPATASFWVDTNANIPYSEDAVDILEPYIKDGVAYLYLPAGTETDNLKFYTDSEGIKVNGTTITSAGTAVNVTPDGTTSHTLEGTSVNTLKVYQSTASAMYTITGEALPTTPGYDTGDPGYHKDDYNSENEETADGNTQYYAIANPDGSLIADKDGETVPVLNKVKGRGNSSWKASAELFGKYAFNITLGAKSNLLDSGSTKKYCLVSYNADEARMRNMLTYSLSQEIGLEFVANFKPVDLYNNHQYIGSYLLTDKVEIGDEKTPLVKLDVNLDKLNEESNNDGDDFVEDQFGYLYSNKGSNSVDEETQIGFYKYVGMTEIDASLYQNSGFLLEFENFDRFAAELSGFISDEGQQIVCKYPECASYNQIIFIMDKWNKAEEKIYDSNTDYETLSTYIDVESFAKMYLIQELTKNVDAGATSYYVWYDDGKFHAGCSWDYDWALGQYAKQRDLIETSSKFASTNSMALSYPQGWWASIKGIYSGFESTTGKLNAQAALCHNDAFWSVVVAEWNENFYPIISDYVVNSSSTTSVSNLSSAKIFDFYTAVHASTLMDESRWGFIAADKLGSNGENDSWGSKDTGDTHDAATLWLNDFIYDRITWMNDYTSSTYNTLHSDYDIQPPVISLATDMPEDGFEIGTELVLNIDDKTDGSYVYTIYKNGTVIGTTQDNTYPITVESGENVYTVKAKSTNSQKESGVSNEVTVEGSGYPLSPTLSASAAGSVLTGTNVTLVPSIAEDYTGVTYEIYYKVDGGEAQLLSGRTYTQDTTGTVEFYVVATATVEGETITAESDKITVKFTEFTVALAATNNGSIMQSQSVTITATPSISENVTYTFYKGEEVIPGYENVMTNTYTEKLDDAGTFEYKVVATYSDRSAEAVITVTVAEFDGTFNVKILFKSSTVYSYRPNMTINGQAVDLVEETAIQVNKVGKGISDYRWYSYTFAEDQTYGTEITVNVTGNRDYFYNASYTFEVGNTDFDYESNGSAISYYFALDNLNDRSVKSLTNVSLTMDAYQRNWTESAVHMIYNADVDGELIAPLGFSFRFADFGDANCDGKINIKDATYVQKSLANIVIADEFSTTVSDFNHDGKVTIKDATAIQKQIAGL